MSSGVRRSGPTGPPEPPRLTVMALTVSVGGVGRGHERDPPGVPPPGDGYKQAFMDDLQPDGALCEERVAHNEVVVRRVNEAIEEGLVNRTGTTGFVCECGQLGCNTVLELS